MSKPPLFNMRDSAIAAKVLDYTINNPSGEPYWVGFTIHPKPGDPIPGHDGVVVADVWETNESTTRPLIVWAVAKAAWPYVPAENPMSHVGSMKQ